MIKRSQLWCYSTCQRPFTSLDMIFYCRNYKLLVSPFHAVTGSIATLLAAVKELRIHDAISLMLSLKFGVPQGSILGPVMFTIYVNDLLSVPTYCKSACYVDDSKLYLSLPSSDMSTAIHK